MLGIDAPTFVIISDINSYIVIGYIRLEIKTKTHIRSENFN